MPGFLKTGLAKVRAHSTTWQLKTVKFLQNPIKSLYPWSLEAFQQVER